MHQLVLFIPEQCMVQKLQDMREQLDKSLLHHVRRVENEAQIRSWKEVGDLGEAFGKLLDYFLMIQNSLGMGRISARR